MAIYLEDEQITEFWDYLVDEGIAEDDEIRLVTQINGYTVESLEAILYARTGYRTLEQHKEDYEEEA